MTVCIAAICQDRPDSESPPISIIIAATDRQLTAGAGEIQFEPPVGKLWYLSPGCAALIAGNLSAQAEICTRTASMVPGSASTAADIYIRQLCEHNRKQAERKILWPLGLTMESFLTRQATMSDDVVSHLVESIAREKARIETIICGFDGHAPQISRVGSNGESAHHSAIGFAAVGEGAQHAMSQFMFARYTPSWSFSKALFLTFMAKKHAEVCPSVGKETELFLVLSNNTVMPVNDSLLPQLEDAYGKMQKAQAASLDQSNELIERHVRQLLQPKTAIPPPNDETPAA